MSCPGGRLRQMATIGSISYKPDHSLPPRAFIVHVHCASKQSKCSTVWREGGHIWPPSWPFQSFALFLTTEIYHRQATTRPFYAFAFNKLRFRRRVSGEGGTRDRTYTQLRVHFNILQLIQISPIRMCKVVVHHAHRQLRESSQLSVI